MEELKIILEYNEYHKEFKGFGPDLSYFVIKSKHGSINMFEYVLFHSIDISEEICCHACEFGKFEILKLCHDRGFKHQSLEYTLAARHGSVQCLQFLFDNNVPYPKEDSDYLNDPYRVSVENGNIECLKCLHKNNAPRHSLDDESLSENITSIAINKGKIECLRFLMENGWSKSDKLINFTIRELELDDDVRLEIIKYLNSTGCQFDDSCTLAAEYKLFDCLKLAHTNGCELTTEIGYISCRVGNLEYLKYVHENGIQLNSEMLKLSIEYGNLNCLKYCHENGIQLESCLLAAEKGELECLKYCHENGCEINDDVLDKALKHKNFNCIEYVLNNGAKGPDNIDVLMKDYNEKN